MRGVEGDVTVSGCGQRHTLLELHAACAPITFVQGSGIVFRLQTEDLREQTAFVYSGNIPSGLSGDCSIKIFPHHQTGLVRYRFHDAADSQKRRKISDDIAPAVAANPRAEALSGAPLTGGREGICNQLVPKHLAKDAMSSAAAYAARKTQQAVVLVDSD